MIGLPRGVAIWVVTETVDMRLGHDGLFARVKHKLCKDPYTGLFIFFGKSMDRAKVFYFERGGFIVHYKRLEKGHFHIPPADQPIDATALAMVLDGIDLRKVRRPPLWEPNTPKPTDPVDTSD